ncbi:hypothetical protein BZG36_03712 [Bifiguratus adelaidae]|uniref:Cysteine protease n=1 Tax=Bifiguratus adelaidae TaxID=1938954 RepID=A0A261XXE6_9FUNG|nr:hypothetical protein BZG36_03712 [Bifiguratus adelaidae]
MSSDHQATAGTLDESKCGACLGEQDTEPASLSVKDKANETSSPTSRRSFRDSWTLRQQEKSIDESGPGFFSNTMQSLRNANANLTQLLSSMTVADNDNSVQRSKAEGTNPTTSTPQSRTFSERYAEQNPPHPLADKLRSNTSYITAEIPNKLGHWVSGLWNAEESVATDTATGSQAPTTTSTTQKVSSVLSSIPGEWIPSLKQQLANTPNTSNASNSEISQTPQGACTDIWFLGKKYSGNSGDIIIDSSDEDIESVKSLSRQRSITGIDYPSKEAELPIPAHNTFDNSDAIHAPVIPDTAIPGSLPTPPTPMTSFQRDFTSRPWFTYRHNYPAIRPAQFTTDIGWGCMLRSGQGLLCQTILVNLFGSDWRRPLDRSDPDWIDYVKVFSLFFDEFSSRSPFAIHRIALLGKQYGKGIGEWFGPSTISQVIKVLVSKVPEAGLTVHVATDGVVYKSDVQQVARETQGDDDTQSPKPPGPFKSVLILVSIRLGIDNLNPIYHQALKAYFELPYCSGIAGILMRVYCSSGRPNSSHYFLGVQGNDLIYLDPHYSRPSLEVKPLDEYTEADMATYHCDVPRKLSISQLDPSMLLGFYCRHEEEFDAFCDRIMKIAQASTPIFTIAEKAPDYDDDVRSDNDFGILSEDEGDDDHIIQ